MKNIKLTLIFLFTLLYNCALSQDSIFIRRLGPSDKPSTSIIIYTNHNNDSTNFHERWWTSYVFLKFEEFKRVENIMIGLNTREKAEDWGDWQTYGIKVNDTLSYATNGWQKSQKYFETLVTELKEEKECGNLIANINRYIMYQFRTR